MVSQNKLQEYGFVFNFYSCSQMVVLFRKSGSCHLQQKMDLYHPPRQFRPEHYIIRHSPAFLLIPTSSHPFPKYLPKPKLCLLFDRHSVRSRHYLCIFVFLQFSKNPIPHVHRRHPLYPAIDKGRTPTKKEKEEEIPLSPRNEGIPREHRGNISLPPNIGEGGMPHFWPLFATNARDFYSGRRSHGICSYQS